MQVLVILIAILANEPNEQSEFMERSGIKRLTKRSAVKIFAGNVDGRVRDDMNKRKASLHLLDLAAHVLAYVFNPLLFPVLLFAVVLADVGAGLPAFAGVMAAVLVGGVALPVIVAMREMRAGRVASIQMHSALERRRPYTAAAAGLAAAALAFALADPPAARLLIALAASYACNALLVALVALWWKPSVHLASAAGFVSVLLYLDLVVSFVEVAPLLLLVVLLAWSRTRTQAHTLGETTTGAILGALLFVGELFLASRLGWL